VFDFYIEDDASEIHLLRHIIRQNGAIMGDTTKLKSDVAELAAKLDAFLAKQPPVPVDDQPEIDAIDADIQALAAKIPA